MYAVVVYDVSSEKDAIMHKYLSTKLTWVQNSVFEGEVSEKQLSDIVSFCESVANPDESVRIYVVKSKFSVKRITIGPDRSPKNIL